MFNNFINISDLHRIVEKLKQGEAKKIIKKLLPVNTASKVKTAWEDSENPPRHWWNIPKVEERINYLATGDKQTTFYQYTSDKYLSGQNNLKGLSICCGTGHAEVKWAHTNSFNRIDGFDISGERIRYAKEQAEELNLGNIINYYVDDVLNLENTSEKYDVVFAEGALHHLTPLDAVVKNLKNVLKSDGHFILNDFVGASRFQWPDKQLFYINKLLLEIPIKFRRRWKSNSIKKKHYRPSKLSMLLSDPSEAVESSKILSTLNNNFESIEIKKLGGTILQLLFDDIAHNFVNDNKETNELLEYLFSKEDELMTGEKIESDFVFAIYRNR